MLLSALYQHNSSPRINHGAKLTEFLEDITYCTTRADTPITSLNYAYSLLRTPIEARIHN